MLVCERLFKLLKAAVDPSRRLGKVHMEMGYRFAGERASWLRPDVSLNYPDQPADVHVGRPLCRMCLNPLLKAAGPGGPAQTWRSAPQFPQDGINRQGAVAHGP